MALLVQNNDREEVLRANCCTFQLQHINPSQEFVWAQVDHVVHHALAWPAIHWQVFLLSTSFKRREIALFPNSEKRSEGLLKTRAEGSHASFLPFCPVFISIKVGRMCGLVKEIANSGGSRACSQRKLAGEVWAWLWKCCRHSGIAICLPHRSSSALSCKWSSRCLPVLLLLPDKPAPSPHFLLDAQVLETLPC